MLVFLFLCFFFQTLRGAPLTPDGSQFSVRESPTAPGHQHRTTFDIIRGCLLTIFACVWKSAQPNLNGPRDSGWTCMKRKVVTMFCALMAPELSLFWALRQRSAAQRIADEYNSEFAISSAYRYYSVSQATTSCIGFLTLEADLDEKKNKSLWRKFIGWFHPLPEETTHRGAGQAWTTTHGFFIQMGGFILYSNSKPVEVLTYKELALLLKQKAIDAPTVTERELQDRSKGDWISKGIVVLQTTWFVVQCLARMVRRLPLSELEVLTLAFAVMNGAIYAAWWDKPQGVDTAICVPLRTVVDVVKSTVGDPVLPSVARGQEASADQSPLAVNALPHPESRSHLRMSDSVPLVSPPHEHAHVEEEHIEHASWKWLRSQVRRDRDKHSSSSLIHLLRLPYLLLMSILQVLQKSGSSKGFDGRYLRVPMFYADGKLGDTGKIVFIILGALFGAVHLLAWSSEFASTRDLVLWRVSAVNVTVAPVLVILAAALDSVASKKQSGLKETWAITITSLLLTLLDICERIIALLFKVSSLLYVPARVVLIFVAFNAFRDTPPGVLVDVPWTSYLPHF